MLIKDFGFDLMFQRLAGAKSDRKLQERYLRVLYKFRRNWPHKRDPELSEWAECHSSILDLRERVLFSSLRRSLRCSHRAVSDTVVLICHGDEGANNGRGHECEYDGALTRHEAN